MKGPTIMIGLLGKEPEMEKGEGLLESECPLATKDEIVNKGNRQKAVLMAELGPPKVKGQNCGNCEYGLELPNCDIPDDMVFCEKFEFKCMKKNWCNRWEPKEESED